LLHWFQVDPQAPAIDTLANEVGTATDDLEPGAVGRIELRGTVWSARNETAAIIPRGTRCRVMWVEGLLAHVEPEGGR
jgi:membrane protein implicated in regulation of membrane protease activity